MNPIAMIISAWTYIVRNWKWFAIIFLIVLLTAGAITIKILHARMQHFKESSIRNRQNTVELLRPPSKIVNTVSMTRSEVKNSQMIDSLVRHYSRELAKKPKTITKIHEIQGETVYINTVQIDTVYGGISVPVNQGCISGYVSVLAGSDSAEINLKNNVDLSIVGYRKRPKNWFTKFKWNSNKWPVETQITNNCDTAMKWIKNLDINIKGR